MVSPWLDRLRGRPLVHDARAAYAESLERARGFEPEIARLSDVDLRVAFERAEDRERAFAVVREAARRTLGLRAYDEQLAAGFVLDDGCIAELATGEGKTLAAVAPACRNARGGSVHVLTFNDYLARRDAEWMGPVYRLLGVSVGVIQEGMTSDERRRAYASDVTYATAKEVGFDFLRDRRVDDPARRVLGALRTAFVDEADSILIDEARVPLVLAGYFGAAADPLDRYALAVRDLREGVHFTVDEGGRNAVWTDAGIDEMQRRLGGGDLLGADRVEEWTRVQSALHAAVLLQRDVDYLVRDGRIELVDEFTGRVVDDRHLPDGLQAALEAKEGLARGARGRVLGTITLQHLFGFYDKLAGMTATARTSCEELYETYGTRTVLVPPHRPSVRIDRPDRLFAGAEAKRAALLDEIERLHATRRPVLVGTASVLESERLAAELDRRGIPCNVLNAKHDEHEAEIVADAGALDAVTISTNMAGRGTDIRLGGRDEHERDAVVALGGLYVIGTNRHESRRVDDQLRGRAGRQGDPGATRFFVSLDDPLMRDFRLLNRLPGFRPDGAAGEIDLPPVRREVDRTQRIVDGQNAEIRRTLARYAEMIEQQRAQLDERREERLAALANDPGRRLLVASVIDAAWSDHLSFVEDVRDGIHLRTVARLDPLAEFQKEAIEAFAALMRGLDDRIESAVEGGAAAEAPSSTWTYAIHDDPFRDQLFSRVGGTAMGIGLVVNFPLVLLWAIWVRLRRGRR